jgi:predicted lipoprotein with Yx(FWY)xxD motif
MSRAKRLAVSRRVLLLTAAVVLVLAGLAIASSEATNIRLGTTSYGPYTAKRLQNDHHYPIYVSNHDRRDQSRCSGQCLLTFKPVTTHGRVKAWDGVKQGLLGVIDRGHGVKQVTYNHHPLYTSTDDSSPGVALNDGCRLGNTPRWGRWYVIDRDGNPDKRWNCIGY